MRDIHLRFDIKRKKEGEVLNLLCYQVCTFFLEDSLSNCFKFFFFKVLLLRIIPRIVINWSTFMMIQVLAENWAFSECRTASCRCTFAIYVAYYETCRENLFLRNCHHILFAPHHNPVVGRGPQNQSGGY